MSGVDLYEDDSEEGQDVDMEEEETWNPDELLDPFERLEKCAESEKVFHRQMATRTLHEAMRSVINAEDCDRMMHVMQKLAKDPDPNVRSELMEQIPHLAMYCNTQPSLFGDNVTPYMLQIVVTYITDDNNLVRKTSQAALLVLLEQQLVQQSDMKERVCPVIMELSSPDSLDDFRPEAVALMSKTAQLIGKDMTISTFLPRFAEMCTDALFHVRKVCAANFGEMCSVVGQEATEEVLLPKFHYLCEDGVWGVRKACAECFMAVSCSCSLAVRRSELASLFISLICDQSRWVRTAAFQALGAFISTFADPTLTGLYFNEDGVLVASSSDEFKMKLQESMRELDNLDAETKHRLTSKQDSTDVLEQDTNEAAENDKEQTKEAQNGGGGGGGIVEDIIHEEEDGGDSDGEVDEVIDRLATIDIKEDKLENEETEEPQPHVTHVDASVTATVSDNLDSSQDNNPTHNDADSSSASSAADDLKSAEPDVDGTQKNENDSDFNSFQYWRPPLPIIDIPDEIEEGNSKQDGESNSFSNEDKEFRSLQPSDLSLANDMDWVDEEDDYEWLRRNRPLSMCIAISNEEIMTDTCANGGISEKSLLNTRFTQDVIPQALLDHYLSMTDPNRAQTVDAEIARHCAYSLPAVAYTLGRKHWPCIKQLYEQLASDMQWKVRRTLAFSIHELAVIVGDEITNKDLVEVFNSFIKDLDEVRIGILKHLVDFLKLLWPSVRRTYLEQLPAFLKVDNSRNWRFRDDLALQLVDMPHLFSVEDVQEYLIPLALELCEDKVATVRRTAFCAWGSMCSHVAKEGTEEMLVASINQIKDRFFAKDIWSKRQIFSRLCLQILLDSVMPESVFAVHLLPSLLTLVTDPIPNVRITVADTISSYVLQSEYFISTRNPSHAELILCSQKLKSDTDRDVRESICSASEYFDSETMIPV